MTAKAASEAQGAFSDDDAAVAVKAGCKAPAVVLLADGRPVSSWGPEWLTECRDREIVARAVLQILDLDDRRTFLAGYIQKRTIFARLNLPNIDPDTFGAECGRRLTATVLERWERSRARIVGA